MKKIHQPIDGMARLVGLFGETEFVKFAISCCYFFSKEIVKDRHDFMCDSIKRGLALPGRKSDNKNFYGGKKVTRKTEEVIFNDGSSGNILTKIDKTETPVLTLLSGITQDTTSRKMLVIKPIS